MDEQLRTAIDKVHAEGDLKRKTAAFLHAEIQKCGEKQKRPSMRLATLFVSVLMLFLIGGFSHNLYFTPSAYVDIDVNPSIELIMNRLGRVSEAHPYNDEGASILAQVSVRHMSYEQAMQALIDTLIADGYLTPDGLVSVTVQAKDGVKEEKLLFAVSVALDNHHMIVQTDMFPVSADIKAKASSNAITPAKYLAILELQQVDSAATIEGCAGHSISEIRKLTRQHGGGGGHHGKDETSRRGQSGSGGHHRNGHE